MTTQNSPESAASSDEDLIQRTVAIALIVATGGYDLLSNEEIEIYRSLAIETRKNSVTEHITPPHGYKELPTMTINKRYTR